MKQISIVRRAASSCSEMEQSTSLYVQGQVFSLSGPVVEICGTAAHVRVGDQIIIVSQAGLRVRAEVIGFNRQMTQAMSFESLHEIGVGSKVQLYPMVMGAIGTTRRLGDLAVDANWLGRIIDPLGRPLDGKGALSTGPDGRAPRGQVPEATLRARLGPRLNLGVRALDCFVTCCQGQRLGLFAGAGIGKSSLLAMMARKNQADIIILTLIGERGREVREFVEDQLGPEGLARAVVIVATSDAPPLLRRQAAYAAMTVAEHFRDKGLSVLLLMDSITRFCLALREIGLSRGEPPTTRGYPPSVFSELPYLLERAGPGYQRADGSAGFITALFTVLVEGDDHNEPVADTLRSILDGHIILDRHIAEGGRYPAIDVLRSLSRTMPGCNLPEETAMIARARGILATYADMEDMIRLGAYRHGSDVQVDEALILAPQITDFLRQGRDETSSFEGSFAMLNAALSASGPTEKQLG